MPPTVGRRHRHVPGAAVAARLTGQSLLVTYVSVVVLIPLVALLGHAFTGGVSGFWSAVTAPEAVDALELTLGCAALATLVNAVLGTATAWVLVRERFVGQAILNSIIDLPFALPTVVAGVTFLTLYGPLSPVHVNLADQWTGVTVAIMFVTLPFCVRAVQPVLESLSTDAEAAAATLGARRGRVFTSVTLPALWPAILTGSGLAFARAVGEYGSVVFVSGNLPYHTQVASSYIYALVGSDQPGAAAAVAVFLLLVALVVLTTFGVIARILSRRRG
jgi:sulfate/thiosulfate transport system permease protein